MYYFYLVLYYIMDCTNEDNPSDLFERLVVIYAIRSYVRRYLRQMQVLLQF